MRGDHTRLNSRAEVRAEARFGKLLERRADRRELWRFHSKHFVGFLHRPHDVDVLARVFGERLEHPAHTVDDVGRRHGRSAECFFATVVMALVETPKRVTPVVSTISLDDEWDAARGTPFVQSSSIASSFISPLSVRRKMLSASANSKRNSMTAGLFHLMMTENHHPVVPFAC